MAMSRTNGARLLGAVLLLAGGAIHTWLAVDGYGSTDLQAVFLLNGAASAIVAVALVFGRGPIAPLAGVGLSAVSLLAFGLSRVGDGVVGFRATGLEPAPEALLTLVIEGAALAVLAFLALAERHQLVGAIRDGLPSRS